MLPSPEELTYFMEAAGTLNFSRAAERLGISQPSLSIAIRRLETSVGELLFIRSKKGVNLTRAGRHLQLRARVLLDDWNNIRSDAKASITKIQGHYTIGCHPAVANYSLPFILPTVLREHPELEIELVHDISRKIVEGVISSQIDLGIVVNPTNHPDLIITTLLQDTFALFSSKPKQTLESIKSVRDVIYSPELKQSQDILKKTFQKSASSLRATTSSDLGLIAELTARGAGLGILPARVAARADKKLHQIEGTATYKDEVCLIMRVENRNIAGFRYLSEKIKKELTRT